ncbi:pre-rRNA-processing protein TSR2 [Asparagus officinalis]|uniref:pre-rRNA-processing protein TSR2 n=1 Tax=Asparagus officinalis TaxID=4686 RepID=UPI00098E17F8|nr:pre-rRNA-processing protein TSR2 [Asparagus officinalis]XP_020274204.1 pre-rRNA-processing protein TSR2 [Asparagus officinalis]
MNSSNFNGGSEAGPSQTLNPESFNLFSEGISLVLSRWTALQMAIENQWGGRDSRQKSHDLASSILSWFSQSKEPLYIDDLENILDECMALSFNTEIDDGSVEEVAEELMVMHEDCLRGNYESIEKLRKSVPMMNAVSQSKRVTNDDDDDESSDEEASDMMVDEPVVPKSGPQPKQNEMPDEEGWAVVAPRRNRGKKSG